ncbi:hypothetical protein [Paenibacillus rhizophilus]|uniref:Uncharacterized protein n=1 Tax=Paenibacillus rhizophilus TaxID=1850366 RepID=A0A3N9P456_9BACL|nr:hypothetical protein [Paenibacillus rhizophilus]RQW10529.1 hypothetical protein EH198_14765 [Paenibacillus rhizophilus]
MTKKHSILTAALASVLTLQFIIAEPVSVFGAGSSSAGTSAAASITAGTSHAEAVYKASLPLLLSPNKLPEAISYLNANMYGVGTYRATMMTLMLENVQKTALPAWDDKFYNSAVQRKLIDIYEPGDSLAQLADKTKNVNLSLMLRRAAACGYKLETAEGSFFPVIDYDAYRKYKLYVTGDIRDYISIMAVESNFPSSKDNGLVIAWTEVASRALAQESFLSAYPRSNRLGIVKQLYRMYETDTFYGLNNTPLFHYDNLEMDLEAQKAYGAILAKSTGKSAYLEKLDGFMKLAKEHDYKLTDEIELYRRQAAPPQE